jgi:hypothetical protein
VRKVTLAVLAVAVALSSAAFVTQANARNICGMNGCAPVFVKRFQVPPHNIAKTTAPPLVVSNAPAPVAAQSALPSLPALPALPSLSSLLSPLGLLGK